ncbi:MAG: C4-type zinc ribbon domain-containing protein [Bacteroidales bacterium]|jgi:predicted  nucleic acid-binding Zn-ribbon protein|nr:C4-type zinc ribbon domain-containing protein [Bacteroidales bacterium]
MAKKEAKTTKATEEQQSKIIRSEEVDKVVENRLIALYSLQKVHSNMDKIRIVRGELPLEVQDLEDEIVGLGIRVEKFRNSIKEYEAEVNSCKEMAKEHEAKIKKFTADQNKVKNNREYESLDKEIEFSQLEVQLCEKKIREAKKSIESYSEQLALLEAKIVEKKKDLEAKKVELDEIIKENEEREKELLEEVKKTEHLIEDRYLNAYKRIRNASRNGLAVVTVDRDACGGCFSKIPHQRQMDIRKHKKIIVCEYCGRILVDDFIAAEVEQRKN